MMFVRCFSVDTFTVTSLSIDRITVRSLKHFFLQSYVLLT